MLIFFSFKNQAKIGTYLKIWGRVVISFINDVSSGGYQAISDLNRQVEGIRGDHKIEKMGRCCLWMVLKQNATQNCYRKYKKFVNSKLLNLPKSQIMSNKKIEGTSILKLIELKNLTKMGHKIRLLINELIEGHPKYQILIHNISPPHTVVHGA